jgi:hypothetical protein
MTRFVLDVINPGTKFQLIEVLIEMIHRSYRENVAI